MQPVTGWQTSYFFRRQDWFWSLRGDLLGLEQFVTNAPISRAVFTTKRASEQIIQNAIQFPLMSSGVYPSTHIKNCEHEPKSIFCQIGTKISFPGFLILIDSQYSKVNNIQTPSHSTIDQLLSANTTHSNTLLKPSNPLSWRRQHHNPVVSISCDKWFAIVWTIVQGQIPPNQPTRRLDQRPKTTRSLPQTMALVKVYSSKSLPPHP